MCAFEERMFVCMLIVWESKYNVKTKRNKELRGRMERKEKEVKKGSSLHLMPAFVPTTLLFVV